LDVEPEGVFREVIRRKKSMKKLLISAVASAFSLAALSVHANLVINGGFETGGLAPWAQVYPQNPVTIVGAGLQHSGDWAAQLGPRTALTGTAVWQLGVPTLAGDVYFIDFWARTTSGGTIQLIFDGIVNSWSIGAATPYSHYVLSAPATITGPSPLQIFWGSTGVMYLDDVSIVPEPTTLIAGALLLLPFGVSTLRMLRKRMA
jgi:hypothetical protein